MLQAIAGPSDLSPLTQPMHGRDFVKAVEAGPTKNVRVAYCADLADIGVDPDIERVCREAAFALEAAGAAIEEIDLDLSPGRPAFVAVRGLWFVTQMFPRLEKQGRFGVNVANNVRSGLEVSSRDLAAAESYRGRLWHQLRDLFRQFDCLLTPCVAVPPFPVEQNYPESIAGTPMKTYIDWIAPTFVLSLTGLPVACVPAGLDSNGMPVGIQIAGKQMGEEAVLALAAQIEQVRPVGLPGKERKKEEGKRKKEE
jgi:amidase